MTNAFSKKKRIALISVDNIFQIMFLRPLHQKCLHPVVGKSEAGDFVIGD